MSSTTIWHAASDPNRLEKVPKEIFLPHDRKPPAVPRPAIRTGNPSFLQPFLFHELSARRPTAFRPSGSALWSTGFFIAC
jgi:hypothetical protein